MSMPDPLALAKEKGREAFNATEWSVTGMGGACAGPAVDAAIEAAVKSTPVRTLCEFFAEGYDNDPSGVADWLAQGGEDADAFMRFVRSLLEDPHG